MASAPEQKLMCKKEENDINTPKKINNIISC